MEFDHEDHPGTGIKLISASEELIEILEDNQARMKEYKICSFCNYVISLR